MFLLCECCVCITHSLQALETWAGTVYLQSMIMVRVSLSLASWKGGWPHTNMNRITPRLQISEAEGTKQQHNVNPRVWPGKYDFYTRFLFSRNKEITRCARYKQYNVSYNVLFSNMDKDGNNY